MSIVRVPLLFLVDRLKKEIADKESNANDKNEKAEKKSTQSGKKHFVRIGIYIVYP